MKLWAAIPRETAANLEFRKGLHGFLSDDPVARAEFLACCFVDPRIFFNACLWTPAPRVWQGPRNVPFILYPHQEPAVLAMKECCESGRDMLIEKSRDEGATTLVVGMGMLYWLLTPNFQMLWGSRSEDFVDKSSAVQEGSVVGAENSIFYKMLYQLTTLPAYMQPKYFKSQMLLQNLENGSCHNGSTTNLGFGKSNRGAMLMVDEFAAIEPKLAQQILENVAATSSCCIFNSTQGPWAGAHPYDKMLHNETVKHVVLDWKDNPHKNPGLYSSPEAGRVILYDVEYYRQRYPKRFDSVVSGKAIAICDIEGTYPFVADGGVSCYHSPRSPWLDEEYKRPSGTSMGVAQNILRIAVGSTDAFFPYDLLTVLRDWVRDPNYVGTLQFEITGRPCVERVRFVPDVRGNLKWWGSLPTGRPDQGHNYAVGCDISRGTGTTNSVAWVLDVNTRELIGQIVTPYHRIEKFAELAVALCEWLGGEVPPLLNWETNGASEFGERLSELGYWHLWEKIPQRTGRERYGWRSTSGPTGTKIAMLSKLSAALYEGLRETSQFDVVTLYDEQTINEMEQYIFFAGRVDVGMARQQTDSSGAKAGHGDRVIAAGLALLAAGEQTAGDWTVPEIVSPGSFLGRMQERERNEERERRQSRIYIF